MLYRVFGHWEKNTIFLRVKISFLQANQKARMKYVWPIRELVVKRIATDVLLFFNFVYIINRKIHGCLEIPYLFLVLNMPDISLVRCEISCSTLARNKSGITAHPCIILYLLHYPQMFLIFFSYIYDISSRPYPMNVAMALYTLVSFHVNRGSDFDNSITNNLFFRD